MLTETHAAAATYRRDLGAGLVLRWSTVEDTENIAQLCSIVFRDKEDEPPNENIMRWIRQLMSGEHPLMGPGDYGVVEDTQKEGNPIIACTCLLRQQWEYEGIRFPMGRPEIVASDPTYRKRGLIRALFEMVHARSEAEGHMVQAVTGIPYFYRQFGYEYALDLGGKRKTYLSLIPKAKEGETEPYTLRAATAEDIPLMLEFYNSQQAANVVWTHIPTAYMQYHLGEWKKRDVGADLLPYQMIVDTAGAAKGFVWCAEKRWGRALDVFAIDIAPGLNVQKVLPPLLRALKIYAERMPTRKPDIEALSEIHFYLHPHHPILEVLGDTLAPSLEPPYAYYVRVPDLPAFIQHIAPALEKRLAGSPITGYTGELKLNFYRGGLRLAFEDGHLTTAAPWQAPIYNNDANAGFPPLVFLQLLFGHRSLDELRRSFPDVRANDDTVFVLKTLFPARPSYVIPL